MKSDIRNIRAALSVLVGLQVIMLFALFTDTSPHPLLTTPLFAMAPFLGASISIAAAALMLTATPVRLGTRSGMAMSLLAALLALVSFGPQKWLDPAIPAIWPAVLCGQVSAVLILWFTLRSLLGRGPVQNANP